MNKEDHIKRHQELHKALDELLADFFFHTEKLFSESTIVELMQWSHQPTIEPSTKEG